MPKIVPELTDVAVRNLSEAGLYPVGGVTGLKLQVSRSGARSWILRVTVAGKIRDIGLGGYPGGFSARSSPCKQWGKPHQEHCFTTRQSVP